MSRDNERVTIGHDSSSMLLIRMYLNIISIQSILDLWSVFYYMVKLISIKCYCFNSCEYSFISFYFILFKHFYPSMAFLLLMLQVAVNTLFIGLVGKYMCK